MAYYNPNRQDPYYDPQQNVGQSGGVAQAVGSFAKNAVGFMVLQGVASLAIGALSKFGANKLSASKFTRFQGVKTLGQAAQRFSPVKTVSTAAKQLARPYTQAYGNRKAFLGNLSKSDPLAAQKARISSIFKDRKTFIGTAGKAFGKHALQGSVIGYAYDSMTGQLPGMGVSGDVPWYNLPGHAANYTKYMAKNAAMFTAFGSIGALAGGARGAVGTGLRNVFDNNQGLKDKVLKGMQSVSRPMVSARKAVGNRAEMFSKQTIDFQNRMQESIFSKTVNNFKASVGAVTQVGLKNARNTFTEWFQHDKAGKGRGIATNQAFNTKVMNALKDVREIWNQKRTAANKGSNAGLEGIQMLETFEKMANLELGSGKTNMSVNRSSSNTNQFFSDMVARHNKAIKPKGLLSDVLRLKPTRIGDVVNTNYTSTMAKRIAKKYYADDWKPIKSSIEQAFVGGGRARSGKFHVGLNFFSPLHMAKRAAQKIGGVNLSLAVGLPPMGRNITLGSITGLSSILSDSPSAQLFTQKTTGLGKIVKATDPRDGKLKPRTLRQVVADADSGIPRDGGFGGTSVNSQKTSVAFVSGKWYQLDGGGMNELSQINETVLKYSNAAIRGAPGEAKLNELQDWMHHNYKEDDSQKLLTKITNSLRGKPENMFQAFAQKFDFHHYGAKNVMRKVKSVMTPGRILNTGKRLDYNSELYAQMAEGLLGKNIDYSNLKKHVPVINELLSHSTQEVGALLKRPTVFNELAQKIGLKGKDFDGMMHSDEAFSSILKRTKVDDKALYDKLTNSRELKTMWNMAVHTPNRAADHIALQRMGRFSEMSVMDVMRTHYVTEKAGIFAGVGANATINPLTEVGEYLSGKGVISHRQGQAFKLHGTLKSIFPDGRLRMDPSVMDQTERASFKAIRDHHKKVNKLATEDVIKYISNANMRAPTLNPTWASELSGTAFSGRHLRSEISGDFDASPWFSLSVGKGHNKYMAGAMKTMDIASNRLVNLIGETTGLVKDPFKYGANLGGNMKFISTRAAQIAGGVAAYKTLDAFIAGNPTLDDTSLDAGMTGFIADNVAKTHLISSRILNVTGAAGVARHLDGLMPGFNSTAPGAIAGAAMNWKGGAYNVAGGIFKGALANRMLSPFMPNFMKDYEQLKSEYSGETEVPIIEGKGWLLGTTPWQGKKVAGWSPNWYVQAKSRWKSSDSLYGSELRKLIHEPIFPIGVNIGDILDPYYMERKHFFSRPYPETSAFGEEIPLGLGSIVGSTIGRVIKPKKKMHYEFLNGSDPSPSDVTAMPVPTFQEEVLRMKSGTFKPGSFRKQSTYMGTHVSSGTRWGGQAMADRGLSALEDGLGLAGFAVGSIRTGLTGTDEVMPTLETSGRLASQSRSYYDMNLGGLGIYSEVLRRFVKKPDWRRYGINPIPNLLPNWLPERMLTGDPYAKLTRGELRLPGPAYESTHSTVEKTMPGRASMFGGKLEDIVSYFTGTLSPVLKDNYDILNTGTALHEGVQQWLAAEGLLISAEDLLYDAKSNVSGHIDGIIHDGMGGGGRRALEIKSIKGEGLKKLDGPKYQHVGQLNFYLHQTKMQKGTIMYVSRDNPSEFKMYEVSYNPDRYAKDLQKIHKAREIASKMLAKGIEGDSYGFSYSWLDRMNILADVAPGSKQYKEAKSIVDQQIKAGYLDQKQITKYETAKKHRSASLRQYELYPSRFRGQIMSPSTEYNIQNINENIKAGAEYSLPERIVGAAWENFTNMNIGVVNKFFAYKDPLEHYKQYQLYGKEYTPWTDPYGSFIKPGAQRSLSQTNAIGGALSFGLGPAYMLGGRAGGIYGAIAGGVYGAAHGMVRKVTNTAMMPGNIEKERQINDYFDKLKYYRNTRMSELSNGLESQRYRNQSNATMMGILQGEGGSYTDLFRGAPTSERSYLGAWLNETNVDRREDILRHAPENVGHALQSFWQNSDDSSATKNFVNNTSADMANGHKIMPYSMAQLDPSIALDDIKLKLINKQGLEAHDYGLGWGEQMIRAQNEMGRLPDSDLNTNPIKSSGTDSSAARSAIYALCNKLGIQCRVRIFINEHAHGNNKVTLTVQRSRLQEMRNALDFRERFK